MWLVKMLKVFEKLSGLYGSATIKFDVGIVHCNVHNYVCTRTIHMDMEYDTGKL